MARLKISDVPFDTSIFAHIVPTHENVAKLERMRRAAYDYVEVAEELVPECADRSAGVRDVLNADSAFRRAIVLDGRSA